MNANASLTMAKTSRLFRTNTKSRLLVALLALMVGGVGGAYVLVTLDPIGPAAGRAVAEADSHQQHAAGAVHEEPTQSAAVREFTLTAEEVDWEIVPGTTVRAWTYNRQMPGPEIRVREGDLVRVTLVNRLPVPTTVHWHGINLKPEMDGPAGLNQAAVAPGEEFVYEFVATPAGSRMYHSHADPTNQVSLGLYGPFIVEPREPARNVTYDRDYTYMLNEWDLELTPDVAAGTAPRGPRDSTLRGGELGTDLFLINGRAFESIPPIRLTTGERVLIRLMNLGNLPHAIHSHGHSFKIVATDGNPVPEGMELVKDTVLVGPGERYDIELFGDNPGVWMFHCHMEYHADNGMMTLIAYDGYAPTGPAAAAYGTPGADVHDHGGLDQSATPTPTAVPTPDNSTLGALDLPMVDNRFMPPDFSVPAGTTVVWGNRGANAHSVKAYDGSFESTTIGPGETYSFRFDQPGTYQYLCKQHGRQGMLGTITVLGPARKS